MKSLIVGCSITHGSELFSNTYHPNNVSNSYANLLSRELGFQPTNLAIPGNSNERIFHDAINNLEGHDLLIVGWTSLVRESWRHGNLDYFFNPNWACAIDDLSMSSVWVKDRPIKTVTSDQDLLDDLQLYHKFFVSHKSDRSELQKKVMGYRFSLMTISKSLGIRYIDLCLIDHLFADCYFFDVVNTCFGKHPTAQHHIFIKDQILRKVQ